MARYIDVRAILEELFKGSSLNSIASTLQCSKHSVMDVRATAKEKGIVSQETIPDVTDKELYRLFFPDRNVQDEGIGDVDYEKVHRELTRKGVTLTILYDEYEKDCDEKGLIAISYSSFTRGYSTFTEKKGYVSHLIHKPGDRIEVDWAGPTLKYFDLRKGIYVTVYLFVSDLVSSRLVYVEPTLDMKEMTWLQCHVNMFNYYGGVTRLLVCDNLKTGVVEHPKEGEIVLTWYYERLAEHYGTGIVPCEVKKPRQKNSVENSVYEATMEIIGKLRDVEFLSFDEVKKAVAEKVEEINNKPFQKRTGTRRSNFEEFEKSLLKPLPVIPFDIGTPYSDKTVQANSHVFIEKNWYSFPSKYGAKKVNVVVTATEVILYYQHMPPKRHLKVTGGYTYQYVTDIDDLPKNREWRDWSPDRFLKWAADVGPSTLEVIKRILSSRVIVEQTFNTALSILSLTKSHSKERIEEASREALSKVNSPRYKHIKAILSQTKEKENTVSRTADTNTVKAKGCLLGKDYFKNTGVKK